MDEQIEMRNLSAPPDADLITELRDQAHERGEAVGITFPTHNGPRKRFVVSPRGTCTLLNDTREETFNRSVSADEIAGKLRE
ncbi:MAG: hypothetical protein ABEL51_13335 [Salinibacter sp.]